MWGWPAGSRYGEGRVCGNPKTVLVVRLPSETERLACHMHLRIVPGRPSLAEAPKGDVFCGEAYVMLALKILGRKEKESIT